MNKINAIDNVEFRPTHPIGGEGGQSFPLVYTKYSGVCKISYQYVACKHTVYMYEKAGGRRARALLAVAPDTKFSVCAFDT